jgi:high-affinity Fe2+/Pb2+ permease
MIDFRIVAILIVVAITFVLQNWLDARWYVSVSSGVVGYLIARFIGWAINERISLNSTKQRDPLVK